MGYCIVSCAKSRIVDCTVDEDVLGERFFRSEVTRSPLASIAMMLLGMDDIDTEVDLVVVLVILSRAMCSAFVIGTVAASFSTQYTVRANQSYQEVNEDESFTVLSTACELCDEKSMDRQ